MNKNTLSWSAWEMEVKKTLYERGEDDSVYHNNKDYFYDLYNIGYTPVDVIHKYIKEGPQKKEFIRIA